MVFLFKVAKLEPLLQIQSHIPYYPQVMDTVQQMVCTYILAAYVVGKIIRVGYSARR